MEKIRIVRIDATNATMDMNGQKVDVDMITRFRPSVVTGEIDHKTALALGGKGPRIVTRMCCLSGVLESMTKEALQSVVDEMRTSVKELGVDSVVFMHYLNECATAMGLS